MRVNPFPPVAAAMAVRVDELAGLAARELGDTSAAWQDAAAAARRRVDVGCDRVEARLDRTCTVVEVAVAVLVVGCLLAVLIEAGRGGR